MGLILSGGGARGFAHIGVLRVLEREGAKFDVIAGTSMGAIIGALYASGKSADEIYEITRDIGWRDVIDLSLRTGVIKGDRLQALLKELLPATFEELETRLAIVTTDIESGEEVLHTEGDLIVAVRASSSFPGAFEPIHLDGRTLADGGIVNNLPVGAATVLGANRTVASDVTPPRQSVYVTPDEEGNWWERMVATVKLERRNPMAQMLFRSSDIMQSILVDIRASIHPADLRIRMSMPQYRIESFGHFEEIVAEGEREAERALKLAGGWAGVLRASEEAKKAEPSAAPTPAEEGDTGAGRLFGPRAAIGKAVKRGAPPKRTNE